MPVHVDPREPAVLAELQEILSSQLLDGGPRYSIHPGDLAWWVWHADQRHAGTVTYWQDGERGFAVLDTRERWVDAFTLPGTSPLSFLLWGLDRIGPEGRLAAISSLDQETEAGLMEHGLTVVGTFGPLLLRDLTAAIEPPTLPDGWELRHVSGEEEADARRRASHAAFQSTLEPGPSLERYLRFMRSPVYEAERDLVAVAPGGRVASFIVWWPDRSGIAQIEPFGTDPDFQRQGIGRALMLHALHRMKDSGMTRARVITDSYRSDAIGFYRALGFEHVADLRTWGFATQ